MGQVGEAWVRLYAKDESDQGFKNVNARLSQMGAIGHEVATSTRDLKNSIMDVGGVSGGVAKDMAELVGAVASGGVAGIATAGIFLALGAAMEYLKSQSELAAETAKKNGEYMSRWADEARTLYDALSNLRDVIGQTGGSSTASGMTSDAQARLAALKETRKVLEKQYDDNKKLAEDSAAQLSKYSEAERQAARNSADDKAGLMAGGAMVAGGVGAAAAYMAPGANPELVKLMEANDAANQKSQAAQAGALNIDRQTNELEKQVKQLKLAEIMERNRVDLMAEEEKKVAEITKKYSERVDEQKRLGASQAEIEGTKWAGTQEINKVRADARKKQDEQRAKDQEIVAGLDKSLANYGSSGDLDKEKQGIRTAFDAFRKKIDDLVESGTDASKLSDADRKGLSGLRAKEVAGTLSPDDRKALVDLRAKASTTLSPDDLKGLAERRAKADGLEKTKLEQVDAAANEVNEKKSKAAKAALDKAAADKKLKDLEDASKEAEKKRASFKSFDDVLKGNQLAGVNSGADNLKNQIELQKKAVEQASKTNDHLQDLLKFTQKALQDAVQVNLNGG